MLIPIYLAETSISSLGAEENYRTTLLVSRVLVPDITSSPLLSFAMTAKFRDLMLIS
jgi:hypothetical protein